jgi:hypothetical protein
MADRIDVSLRLRNARRFQKAGRGTREIDRFAKAGKRMRAIGNEMRKRPNQQPEPKE